MGMMGERSSRPSISAKSPLAARQLLHGAAIGDLVALARQLQTVQAEITAAALEQGQARRHLQCIDQGR